MKLITKFEDEAFKLNETVNVDIATIPDGRIKAQAVAQSGGVHTFFYDDLKTFANDWEDCNGLEYWYIDNDGVALFTDLDGEELWESLKDMREEIGNYFKTEEETKNAVEKLKAWKRLKDKGFRFELWDYDGGNYQERIKTGRILFRVKDYEEVDKLLDLLFGGKE